VRYVVTLRRGRFPFFGEIVFVEIAAFHRSGRVPARRRPETRTFGAGLALA
jgi:hypothetical protein